MKIREIETMSSYCWLEVELGEEKACEFKASNGITIVVTDDDVYDPWDYRKKTIYSDLHNEQELFKVKHETAALIKQAVAELNRKNGIKLNPYLFEVGDEYLRLGVTRKTSSEVLFVISEKLHGENRFRPHRASNNVRIEQADSSGWDNRATLFVPNSHIPHTLGELNPNNGEIRVNLDDWELIKTAVLQYNEYTQGVDLMSGRRRPNGETSLCEEYGDFYESLEKDSPVDPEEERVLKALESGDSIVEAASEKETATVDKDDKSESPEASDLSSIQLAKVELLHRVLDILITL